MTAIRSGREETPPAATPPAAIYRQRRDAVSGEQQQLAARSRTLSWGRLTAAVAAAGCLLWALVEAAAPPSAAVAGAAAAVVVFIALAAVHARVIRRQRRAGGLARLQTEALARLARDWDQAPAGTAPAPGDGAHGGSPAAALEHDLDLFGHASLFQLLGTAHTPPGRRTLAGWIRTPAPPAVIARRQAAVRALAPRLGLRQELELAARPLAAAEPDPEPFLAWAEGEPWLRHRPALLWAGRLLPFAAFGGLAAAIAGLLPWSLGLLPAIINLLLSRALGDRFADAFDRLAAGERDILAYSQVLRLVGEAGLERGGEAAADDTSERLAELAAELTSEGRPAWRRMRTLRRRIEIADARHGAFHPIPQALVLWDVHALWLLERWQAADGGRVRRWLEALGELEALAALAGLAHDEPDWAYPTVDAAAPPLLDARALGHPLLPDAERVDNDVRLGPPGSFLLVTGSNMSGKSTLLRAVGVNTVLAQAGGPVCAAALHMPPLTLATSIRVEDSLADGVSRYMAELLRIRDVVAAARGRDEGAPLLLYLIDEALAGTNSRERRTAVRRVLAHLLTSGAIGAITTHDLELAETEELRPGCQAVHFRETVHARPSDGRTMTFDYRLRPGLATTSNALALLDLVGLGEA